VLDLLRLTWLRRNGALRMNSLTSGASEWSRRGEPAGSLGWQVDASDSRCLTLDYAYTPAGGERASIVDRFRLTTTSPYLGGLRWWIECTCGRRVAQLCKPSGASRFRCRLCYRLAYESQRETREWRAYRRVRKIARRLSAEWAEPLVPADVLDGFFFPPKPTWMRWKTYNALAQATDRSALQQQTGMLAALERLMGRN
jgi:hypothetical protein